MAIVQISQITNRKGLQENLPQLAGAELGYSIDQRRLFIGNGTLEQGAPVIGNTEILTEFSDILGFQTLYTYQGEAAGYTVQTGPTAGTPVTQSLQSWLDQFATVKDFGAVGDGVADDTDAINRALFELFCRESNPQIRRSLFFPAGVYKVNLSINIPPYATLYGEGPENSVIQLEIGDDSTLHACVARTADSLQQIGANIGNSGATAPEFITVSNLGFSSLDPTVDVFLVQDAKNCTFTNVSFTGPLTQANLSSAGGNIRAVAFASSASNICDQIVFVDCKYSGTTYGTQTGQEIRAVSITNSQFDTLYQGVVLADDVTGFRVSNNQFDKIYAQGIVFNSLTGRCASGHNMFYDVGNHFLGSGNPFTTVIDMLTNDNISMGDMFQRDDADAQIFARIQQGTTVSISTTNGAQLALGQYVRQSGRNELLLNNTSATVFTFSTTVAKAFMINYTIIRNVSYRTGTIMVATDSGASDLDFDDNFVENNNTGVTLNITQTGDIVSLNYATTNIGINATITYSINYLA